MTTQDSFASRTEMLLHADGVERLRRAHVLVVGLGGVGGYAAEMLCRAGVGKMTIVDGDVVSQSNINRQLIALHSTVGLPKAALFKARFADINPDCEVDARSVFLRDDEMIRLLEEQHYDYVVDAIDTLSPKVFLLYHSHRLGLAVVSSMGSAGKLDPTQLQIADIGKSHTCPLAAMVRKKLHKLGVREGIDVVFSTEKIPSHAMIEEPSQNKRTTIGTISYLPPAFGCACASVVIRNIVKGEGKEL
ncbi:MAG: tRNA threonylcarbamoyladenosine dehydratase [Bacteroidales bacterium]|nr:tRNA threonylcarbamoyladenosine dehydratase [Bacteroidales bacterium]